MPTCCTRTLWPALEWLIPRLPPARPLAVTRRCIQQPIRRLPRPQSPNRHQKKERRVAFSSRGSPNLLSLSPPALRSPVGRARIDSRKTQDQTQTQTQTKPSSPRPRFRPPPIPCCVEGTKRQRLCTRHEEAQSPSAGTRTPTHAENQPPLVGSPAVGGEGSLIVIPQARQKEATSTGLFLARPPLRRPKSPPTGSWSQELQDPIIGIHHFSKQ